MKTYLLTAVGVIFLTVVVGFIAPDGKLKKSVNFVLRLISVAVIIQPVTQIFKFTPQPTQTTFNYDYVAAVYAQNQSALLTNKLNEDLSLDCVCFVDICYDGEKIAENGVCVQGKFESEQTIEIICEYLSDLGYINISVNEKVE